MNVYDIGFLYNGFTTLTLIKPKIPSTQQTGAQMIATAGRLKQFTDVFLTAMFVTRLLSFATCLTYQRGALI